MLKMRFHSHFVEWVAATFEGVSSQIMVNEELNIEFSLNEQ